MTKERILRAIEQGDLNTVKSLLSHPDVRTLKQFEYPEYQYEFPLDVALKQCGQNGTTPMLHLLVANKFHLNEQTENGYRSVITAARLRNVDALELMQRHGAQLSWPISGPKNWCSAVQGLVPRGRNAGGEDTGFEQTLRWLINNGCSLNNLSLGLLHSAVEVGDPFAVNVLCELGADLNEISYILIGSRRGAPLHAYNGPYGDERGYESVRILLERGADPNIRNDRGLDAKSYYESLFERAREEAGKNEIERVIRLIDPTYSKQRPRNGKTPPHSAHAVKRAGSTRISRGLWFGILAVVTAVIGYGIFAYANRIKLPDMFQRNVNITATVSNRANVRNRPTTIDSQVLTALEPGVTVSGEWAEGSEAGIKWLKIDLDDGRQGFVWEGNLIVD